MLQLPHLKETENNLQSQWGSGELPRTWHSKNYHHLPFSFKLELLSWYLWLYYLISEQSTGSGFSKGIAPRRNPNKQGIFAGILHTVLLEFCSCLRDLCKGKRKKNPERKLIHSQASIRHFLLKNHYQTELESSQVSSWILKHQVNQHRRTFTKLQWNMHETLRQWWARGA